MVVKGLEEGGKDFLDVPKIDRPSFDGIQRRIQVQAQRVGVAMCTRPGTAVGSTRIPRRAIQRELLPNAVALAVKIGTAKPRLEYRDPRQFGQQWFRASPYPCGKVFACRIAESL